MAQIDFPARIFVTGTDTGVGKTLVSAVLAAGLGASYWKPVQSGVEEGTDTDWVREKTGLPRSRFHPEAYRLKLPLSPHAAAGEEGIRIDLDRIRCPFTPSGHLVIEGAGGILVPLNDRHFMLDLILKLDAPVLLVARSTLGTINHTLLSIEHLRRHGARVLGVILNGPKNPGNRKAVEQFGNIKVIGEIEPLAEIDPANLRRTFRRTFM